MSTSIIERAVAIWTQLSRCELVAHRRPTAAAITTFLALLNAAIPMTPDEMNVYDAIRTLDRPGFADYLAATHQKHWCLLCNSTTIVQCCGISDLITLSYNRTGRHYVARVRGASAFDPAGTPAPTREVVHNPANTVDLDDADGIEIIATPAAAAAADAVVRETVRAGTHTRDKRDPPYKQRSLGVAKQNHANAVLTKLNAEQARLEKKQRNLERRRREVEKNALKRAETMEARGIKPVPVVVYEKRDGAIARTQTRGGATRKLMRAEQMNAGVTPIPTPRPEDAARDCGEGNGESMGEAGGEGTGECERDYTGEPPVLAGVIRATNRRASTRQMRLVHNTHVDPVPVPPAEVTHAPVVSPVPVTAPVCASVEPPRPVPNPTATVPATTSWADESETPGAPASTGVPAPTGEPVKRTVVTRATRKRK